MGKIISSIGNAFKFLWSGLSTRIWLINAVVLSIVMITVSIVTTQNTFIYSTLSGVLGGESAKLVSGNEDDYQYFETEYESKADVLEAANAFNETIVEDGIILLKNENNTLPLSTTKSTTNTATSNPKISIFGKNSVNMVYGGSGSSEADSSTSVNLQTALENAGYDINPTLTEFYNSTASGSGRPASPSMGSILTGFPTGETPVSSYTDAVKSSYDSYSDAALVVISRVGGEGYDLPRTMFWNGSSYTAWSASEEKRVAIDGREMDDHYLELDSNELDMIEEAKECSENVIVVVNVSQTMELDFIDIDADIDAAVWIGGPGGTGLNALGSVLNGNVNPSGRTVDTFVTDLKDDPTWNNFGNNLVSNGNAYTLTKESTGTNVSASKYTVDYEEGIYIGYKYYETRSYTEEQVDADSTWYDDAVTYPLGYGLSYTSFDQEIVNVSDLASTVLTEDSTVEVEVKVTNKGDVAGKEVVQIYFTAPYTDGGIEKAHKVLAGFEKTGTIASGESETVTVEVPAYYFASYDYNDANDNGFKGYEIEAGDYTLYLAENAHDSYESVNFTQTTAIQIKEDGETGYTVENRFDDVSNDSPTMAKDSDGNAIYLSRSDWEGTWPTTPTADELNVSQEFIDSMGYTIDDSEDDPWYVAEEDMPSQSTSKTASIMLYEMIGLEHDDAKWDEFMDQIAVDDMATLIGIGNYQTVSIEYIDKWRTVSVDGPVGITAFMGDTAVYDTCSYASGCILAASYNKELAKGFGSMLGDETLIGNEKGSGETYPSWYAPGVNIHRNAFGGRNWEYYSEDATLTGLIGAEVIEGAREKGLVTHVKHFALNDQETNRTSGVSTWSNEQVMRETYLRAFELAIKGGESLGVMTSFNSIGVTWAGGSYELLTEVLRNEWGFNGSVITDYNYLTPYMDVDQMIRAGGDLNLAQDDKPDTSVTSATQVSAIRESAKNILYSIANSSAMNGHGDGNVWAMVAPAWVTYMFLIEAGIVLVVAGIGAFLIIRKRKIDANGESVEEQN